MRVPVGERAEALDADDDAGLTEGGALICEQGAVGELAQGAEPRGGAWGEKSNSLWRTYSCFTTVRWTRRNAGCLGLFHGGAAAVLADQECRAAAVALLDVW